MTLLFELRRVYGKELCYPTNEQAQALVNITGRKCLKLDEVRQLKEAGFQTKLFSVMISDELKRSES